VVNPYEEPELFVGEALDDLAARTEAMRDPLTFRPLIIEMGPYGVHFIDHIFGAMFLILAISASPQLAGTLPG